MNKYPDIVYNNLYIVFKRKPSRCPQRDRIKFSSFYRFKTAANKTNILMTSLSLSPFLSLCNFFFRLVVHF